jgi:protein-disulfide isomerase
MRLAALAAVLLAGCTGSKGTSKLSDVNAAPTGHSAQVATSQAAIDPASTVATVNGQPITGKDLDESIKDDISKETDTYAERLQKLREDGLDELIVQKLVETEAKSLSMSKDDLLKKEVADKTMAPTDNEMHAFYDKYVKPQYNVPFDAVKDQIAQEMAHEKQSQRATAYFAELRTKYKVKVTLPVRRVTVAATGPSRGPSDAKVTIVEFSDFECPFCGRATPTVEEVLKKYDGKVRFVFREFPLPMHKSAKKAAEAALCANQQDKFWPMYDKMFANQEKLEPTDLKGYAKDLGLDQAKFDACLDGGKMESAVQADIEAGKALGVDGTPAFFINGRPYSGAQPLDKFVDVIDSELGNG